ncbi:protein kinase family protein [Parafrankia elaeagni]|uniref:protein kinase family protein n=1 Tax=Parafrankia elaeagni TaxID=222534 RepID=UPI0003A698A8|nr:protein kinase family protein [Parafrankia elaeagni]
MTWSTGSAGGGDWWVNSPRSSRDATLTHHTSRGEPVDALREESIVYRDVRGVRRTMQARVTDDQVDPRYSRRLVVDMDTLTEYVQKRAHAAGRRTPTDAASVSRPSDGIDEIDNEIQTGLHLIDVFGEQEYPRELSRLFGYYPDDADPEPFVLLVERGRPVEQFAGRLLLDQTEQFPASLLRALDLLESAAVVHRWLSSSTVLFDDRHVQITDFRYAVFSGERCGPAPDPYPAPETRGGTGVATPKADMYSAGQVLLRVTDGPRRGAATRRGDEARRGDARRPHGRGVVTAMTEEDPALRPPAAELLERLRQDRSPVVSGAWGPRSERDSRFLAGLSAFDTIARRRRPVDDGQTGPPAGPPGPAADDPAGR